MNMQQTIYDWLGRSWAGTDPEPGGPQVQFRRLLGAAGAATAVGGFVGLVAVSAVFYFRHQPDRHRRWRVMLF